MLTLVRFLLGFMLVFTALFLILLVLIQRGRGGGLAGAFGGAGGQSAFGTKAGDIFTKITIGVAAFWIILCILAINVLGRQQSLFSGSLGSAAPQALQAGPGDTPAAATNPPADGGTGPVEQSNEKESTEENATKPANTEPAKADAAPQQPAADAAPAVPPAPAAPAAVPPATPQPAAAN